MKDLEIKVQACNLCESLVRNINDNFLNISFDLLNNGNIKVKIILDKLTGIEKEYINEISGEFESKQLSDIVEEFEISTKKNSVPLRNIVYKLS
jgi:hypothetical protein